MISNWAVLSFLATLTVVGCGALLAEQQPLVSADRLEQAGLTVYWEAQLPLSRDDSPKDVYLVDEALYVVTEGGILFSVQADVGLLRWGRKVTARDYRVYKPAHWQTGDAAGPVVLQTSTGLQLYDRLTGSLLYELKLDLTASSAAIGAGNTLYTASRQGMFHAFSLRNSRTTEPVERWRVRLDAVVTATPVLYGADKLLFATQGGTLYSCFAEDKAFDWSFRAEGAILGDPFVDAGGAYVASTDRSVYKLDLTRGTVLWRVRLPGPLTEGPTVVAHTLFQYCPGYGIAAIDADTGRRKWWSRDARTFIAHQRDRVVLFTDDGQLQVVDHESGKVRAAISVLPAIHAVTNPHDGAVYLVGPSGKILCARMDGVPYLRRQQVTAARARLN